MELCREIEELGRDLRQPAFAGEAEEFLGLQAKEAGQALAQLELFHGHLQQTLRRGRGATSLIRPSPAMKILPE